MRFSSLRVVRTSTAEAEVAAIGQARGRARGVEPAPSCWERAQCSAEQRQQCAAYNEQRSCWEIWDALPAGEAGKNCCHPLMDCQRCVLVAGHWAETLPTVLAVYRRARRPRSAAMQQVCEHFYVQSQGGDQALSPREVGDAPDDERDVFRCRLRGGTHLSGSYVTDVCLSRRSLECVFRPEGS